jgi:DNA-binding NarL/FixJ family response regulator
MNPIRVLLADDHTLLRAGLRSLLEALEGVVVVAEASDGTEALRLIEIHRPELVLLDIAMPKLTGLDVAVRVAESFSSTRVIIVSMHVDEEYVRKAIMAGAAGYLLKDSGTSELEMAVRAVARGETYLSPAVSTHLIARCQRHEWGEISLADSLTARQREVLQLIVQGLSTKAIARKLEISIKTVETHRTQLMDRLNIHDVAGLVRYALRIGLIKLEQSRSDLDPLATTRVDQNTVHRG